MDRSDIDALVLDYLVHEGYKTAAEKMVEEASLSPPTELDHVDDRMKIRAAVHSGDMETAISLVNDMGTQLLQEDSHLYFMLRLQQLIELIRKQDIDTAILFCQSELAPLTDEHPEYRAEMEEVLGLLIFPDPQSSPLARLLQQQHRQETATHLNTSILKQLKQRQDVKLTRVLKLLMWLEKQLATKLEVETLDWMGPSKPSSASSASPQTKPDNGDSKPTS